MILDLTVTDTEPARAQRIARTLAENLTTKVARLETPASGTSASVRLTIVDPASLTAKPISPQPWRDLGLALVLGLALGRGCAFLRELLDSSVRDPKDVADATGLPVLAQIGDDVGWSKEPVFSEPHAGGPQEEAFRVLRTNLQCAGVDHDGRVCTVSSPLPSEGKTTTATNLASAFAQAGYHVLLIDGDLRHAGLGKHLDSGDGARPGCRLVQGCPLEDAVREGLVPDLTVLPSGDLPPNPAELLQSSGMVDLLTQARKSHDTVIVDAPPLLSGADAAVLAAQSDGTLLVLRHGRTITDQLRCAVDRLAAVDATVVGAVLNRVPKRNDVVRSLTHAHKATGYFKTGH